MFGFNNTELIIIFLIILLLFGPKAVPQLGKSIGRGIRELKDAMSGTDKDSDTSKPETQDPQKTDSEKAAGANDGKSQS